MKLSKAKLITYLFYASLTIAFVGSVTSTLAWFSSFSYARIRDFKGTAVDLNNRALQVGLLSETNLIECERYNLVRDGEYYWSKTDLSEETIKYYLENNGYAFNSLSPITSGEHKIHDDLSLKESPTELMEFDNQKEAEKNTYIKLDLLFRAKISGQIDYLKNENIYLNSFKLVNLNPSIKGIRIYFDGNNKYLTSPCHSYSSLTSEYDYTLDMGGILDLNLDGYYDYSNDREFIYGEVDGNAYYSSNSYSEERKENPTTFLSSHNPDSLILDTNRTIFKKSEFVSLNKIIDKKIALTTTDGEGIARLKIIIYLEGWSKDIIDSLINEYFSLLLSFSLYGDY